MANIDDKTGLPELPEGYFWRVKESVSIFVDVEIRKKWWVGSRQVAWTSMYRSQLSKQKILECARYVLSKWRRDVTETNDSRALLGDYPPKSLNEVTQ